MEVADDAGALTFRTEGAPTLGIGELIADAGTVHSAGHLAGYTAPQTSFAAVIGTVGFRPHLTAEGVRTVAALVDDYYSIRVMDSGNQTSSAAFRSAVETADILVVPVLNSPDAILEAATLLQTLRAASDKGRALADRAVLIRSSDGRPEDPEMQPRIDRVIEHEAIASVFSIPYDPHIAERGPITIAKLATGTREAFTAAAAAIIRSLQSTVR
jgi:MinD-like ATPase involved in chromosome partitioning or flagellar assembly